MDTVEWPNRSADERTNRLKTFFTLYANQYITGKTRRPENGSRSMWNLSNEAKFQAVGDVHPEKQGLKPVVPADTAHPGDVGDVHPEKQGLKPELLDADLIFAYRRRRSSRKTRIETNIRTAIASGRTVGDVHPEKQGLKPRLSRWRAASAISSETFIQKNKD